MPDRQYPYPGRIFSTTGNTPGHSGGELMSRILSRPILRDLLFGSAILLMLLGLITKPELAVSAAREGVELCTQVILPSLFPFFVLSSLVVELGLTEGPGRLLGHVMGPMFHLPGDCAGAFLLGIVGGYPVGARTAIALYQSGRCSRDETERMLSFCNNSGPAFILGVVGAGIFRNSRAGLWLYAAHVAASLMVGLCFRRWGRWEGTKSPPVSPQRSSPDLLTAFPGAVRTAFQGTLNICGFVIFFTVLIRLLFAVGVITGASRLLCLFPGFLSRQEAQSLLTGMIELTSGVWSLRDMAGAMGERLCLAAFMLGWAGMSVHCQVLSFIGQSGLSTRTYFLGKLLHGLLSSGIIWGLSRVLGWAEPVSLYLASEVDALASMDFLRSLTSALAASCAVFLLLLTQFSQKRDGKMGNIRV